MAILLPKTCMLSFVPQQTGFVAPSRDGYGPGLPGSRIPADGNNRFLRPLCFRQEGQVAARSHIPTGPNANSTSAMHLPLRQKSKYSTW